MPRRIEEEDVRKTQHQPRHRHGQHGHQLGGVAHQHKTARLLHHIGAREDDGGAQHGGPGGHAQRVAPGLPALAVKVGELVIGQREAQVVGPACHQRSPDGHAQHHQHGTSHQRTEQPQAPVACGMASRYQRNRSGGEQGHLAALHPAIGPKSDHRRQQEHKPHHGAHLEVLLTDHLLEDVGGQHVEAPADHLGDAEVGDGQGEDHKTGADQAVLAARQGHCPESALGRRTQHTGGLVMARIGHGQRHHQDHQGMGKAVEDLRDHDADGPVDRRTEQPVLEQTLVAKQVDQRNGRQQRGRQNRDQRQGLEHGLARHCAARERIGIHIGQRQHQRGDQRGDPEAVPERLGQRRRGEIGEVVAQAHPGAVGVAKALDQQGAQWQHERDRQPQGQ